MTSGDTALLTRTIEHLRAAADAFPDLSGGVRHVELLGLERRDTSCLYRLRVYGKDAYKDVLAKVRHDRPHGRAGEGQGRPTLTPREPLSPPEAARLEYDGLQRIVAALSRCGDENCFAVRPRVLLADNALIVMDHVGVPTLRKVLLHGSRLRPFRRRDARQEEDVAPWSNAGTWLRYYHAVDRDPSLLARLHHQAELIDLFEAFARYLPGLGVPEPLLVRIVAVVKDVAAALPETFPCAVGHSDFSPRNVFVDPAGRIGVVDPMPRWRVAIYDDLATFLVTMRCVGLQLATRGMAFDADVLNRYEDAFLAGYFAEAPIPRAEVVVFSLLLLLDYWAGLASLPESISNADRRIREVKRWWLGDQYHREARRLVGILSAEVSPGRKADSPPWHR